MGKAPSDVETAAPAGPLIEVAPAPHVLSRALTTRRMMIDVLIALAPVAVASVLVFGWYAVLQILVCVPSCVSAEAILTRARGKRLTLTDCSAMVTGLILAFSLPATAPVWVGIIGSFAAIGLGKIVFGGVGMNIFNPAMVGRAFVMMAFPGALAAGGYVLADASVPVLTHATPMTEVFQRSQDGGAVPADLLASLFLGNTNGSLGETSALACLLGGLYLCIRRTASWEIPAGAILGLLAVAGLDNLARPESQWTVLHHVLGGAFLLGAFFILTDPVTSPLTPAAKLVFGAVFGALVMTIRLFTPYPEGVMFSVLAVNGISPLLNRWMVPRPVGGPVPVKKG